MLKTDCCFAYFAVDFDLQLISALLFRQDCLRHHNAMSLIVSQLLLSDLQQWRD